MDISDYKNMLEALVPGQHPIENDVLSNMKEAAIRNAVKAHSKNTPKIIRKMLTGTGDDFIEINNFAGWVDDFSKITAIYYPVSDIPEELERTKWMSVTEPSGLRVYFRDVLPEAGEEFYINYTGIYTCDENGCDISEQDNFIVQYLAAGHYALLLTGAYIHNNDSTHNADGINHQSKRSELNLLSTRYINFYNSEMYLKSGVKGAGVTVSSVSHKRYPRKYFRETYFG